VTPGSAVERDRRRTALTGFVPVCLRETLALRAGADLGLRSGCAATSALLAELGGQTSIEEAAFAALSHAGVLAVLISSSARRLVLAAELAPDQVADHGSPFGEITIAGLSWSQVRAIFVDEPKLSRQLFRRGGRSETVTGNARWPRRWTCLKWLSCWMGSTCFGLRLRRLTSSARMTI